MVASLSPALKRRLFNLLRNITCKGEPVSSLRNCIRNGTLCNDHGTCINHKCICNYGYSGRHCQVEADDSNDANSTIAIAIGKATYLLVSIL